MLFGWPLLPGSMENSSEFEGSTVPFFFSLLSLAVVVYSPTKAVNKGKSIGDKLPVAFMVSLVDC